MVRPRRKRASTLRGEGVVAVGAAAAAALLVRAWGGGAWLVSLAWFCWLLLLPLSRGWRSATPFSDPRNSIADRCRREACMFERVFGKSTSQRRSVRALIQPFYLEEDVELVQGQEGRQPRDESGEHGLRSGLGVRLHGLDGRRNLARGRPQRLGCCGRGRGGWDGRRGLLLLLARRRDYGGGGGGGGEGAGLGAEVAANGRRAHVLGEGRRRARAGGVHGFPPVVAWCVWA